MQIASLSGSESSEEEQSASNQRRSGERGAHTVFRNKGDARPEFYIVNKRDHFKTYVALQM